MKQKEIVNDLIKDLEDNPDNWKIDNYNAVSKKGNKIIDLYIGIGLVGLSFESPFIIPLTWFSKWRLYKALNQCKYKKLKQLLNETDKI